MKWFFAPLLLALGASACSDRAQDEADPAVSPSAAVTAESLEPVSDTQPVSRDEWVGRWIGVEGLNLTVTKLAKPGHYQLEMQYGTDADMAGAYEGIGTPEGIAFTRPDGKQVLRASSGDETGLKYLAGKTDCLKVKDSEGYCRQ
jgi:hypothetical protein